MASICKNYTCMYPKSCCNIYLLLWYLQKGVCYIYLYEAVISTYSHAAAVITTQISIVAYLRQLSYLSTGSCDLPPGSCDMWYPVTGSCGLWVSTNRQLWYKPTGSCDINLQAAVILTCRQHWYSNSREIYLHTAMISTYRGSMIPTYRQLWYLLAVLGEQQMSVTLPPPPPLPHCFINIQDMLPRWNMDGWVTGCVCFRIRTLLEVFGMHQEEIICIHKYVFYKYICKKGT